MMSKKTRKGVSDIGEAASCEHASDTCFDPDRPLEDPDQDLLGRAPLARRLADGIVRGAETSSIVIGIYGPWGSGKTTVLNFLRKDLLSRCADEVILLDFDPWLVSGEEELLVAFMTSLASAIGGKTVSRGQKAAKVSAEILDYASIVLKFASAVPVLGAAGTVADATDKLKEKLEQLSKTSPADMKNTISQDLRGLHKRIVVFMDDLDRLDKNELHYIMKLVKLVADFPLVTYVLACDDDMVARSIGEMYAKAADVKEAERAGKDYLEKVVQVPIRLPIPTESAFSAIALKAVFESLEQHDATLGKDRWEQQRLFNDFNAGILPFIRTPRRVKQISTRVKWALPTMEHEINTVDVVVLEGMAVCQPRLHQYILDRPRLFCHDPKVTSDTARQRARAELENCFEPEGDGEYQGSWFLIHDLFPRTEWMTSSSTGQLSDSSWEQGQRVADETYLMRYIHMTIPETDVSDAAIRHMIEELPTRSAEQARLLLADILTRQNARSLVFRLRHLATTMNGLAAVALAHAVALLSDSLPRLEGLESLWSAANEGPILVRDLLTRIEGSPQRREVALEVLRESADLLFAIEVFGWIRYRTPPQSSSHQNLFDEEFDKDLADVVLERIRELSKKEQPIYIDNPIDARDLLAFWNSSGTEGEAKSHVTGTIQSNPANAAALLHAFQPTSWSSNGQVFGSDLDAETFLRMSRIVDVSVMRAALETTMGEHLLGEKYKHVPGETDDRQRAEQFAFFCEHPPKTAGGEEVT